MSPEDGSTLPERLRRAALAAGIGPSDPLMAVIEAMGEAAAATRVLSPEAEAELIKRVAFSAKAAVVTSLQTASKVTDRRTALIGAGALLVVASIGGGIGWAAGASRPVATAFGEVTPSTATVLAMNNLDAALAACRGTDSWQDRGSGRRACAVRLWVEPAPVPGR